MNPLSPLLHHLLLSHSTAGYLQWCFCIFKWPKVDHLCMEIVQELEQKKRQSRLSIVLGADLLWVWGCECWVGRWSSGGGQGKTRQIVEEKVVSFHYKRKQHSEVTSCSCEQGALFSILSSLGLPQYISLFQNCDTLTRACIISNVLRSQG